VTWDGPLGVTGLNVVCVSDYLLGSHSKLAGTDDNLTLGRATPLMANMECAGR
jgi:hypothetical protein